MSRHFSEFSQNSFDYIVIDEAHHASSESYQKVIKYFKPNFLLGLTATPERSDNGDIYALFDNNVAVEIRLRQALKYNLICPFHYCGISAVALSNEDNKSIDERIAFTKRLEDDGDDLKVIFTVDLFNEGIDIPSVNTILMLRPTESSIIFIQQLGRGLRKLADKEFVTVLDFIGNYNKSFLMAIALN